MKTFFVVSGMVILGILGMVFGDDKAPPAKPTSSPSKPAVNAKSPTEAGAASTATTIPDHLIASRNFDAVEEALEGKLRRRGSLEFVDASLDEVARVMKLKTGVTFRIQHEFLKEDGIDVESLQLSGSYTDVELIRGLRNLLTVHGLSAYLQSGEVAIGPGMREDRPSTRIYPVADLVAYRANDELQSVDQELIDVLTSTVQPDTWDEVGGPGSIRYERSTMSLIIRQLSGVHDEVENGLATIRQARRELPELLKAAGGPSLAEVRSVDASLAQAKARLIRIENRLRKLDAIDLEKMVNSPAPGAGGNFFDVPIEPGDPLPAIKKLDALDEGIASLEAGRDDARRLALEAVRIEMKFARAIEERQKRSAEEAAKKRVGEKPAGQDPPPGDVSPDDGKKAEVEKKAP